MINWTDELIKEEIFKVADALNLNRMPSKSEIEFITRNSALTNKISKTGGFYKWAEKLDLKIKDSETKLGYAYELEIRDRLRSMRYIAETTGVRHPYDLIVNNAIKVDVKVAKPYVNKKTGRFHTFNLGKSPHTCDIYIIVALDEEGIEEKILIIPSKCIQEIKQLSIGKVSIYDIYKDKWSYIEQYDNFYLNLA